MGQSRVIGKPKGKSIVRLQAKSKMPTGFESFVKISRGGLVVEGRQMRRHCTATSRRPYELFEQPAAQSFCRKTGRCRSAKRTPALLSGFRVSLDGSGGRSPLQARPQAGSVVRPDSNLKYVSELIVLSISLPPNVRHLACIRTSLTLHYRKLERTPELSELDERSRCNCWSLKWTNCCQEMKR
jgi:hypothetical protein